MKPAQIRAVIALTALKPLADNTEDHQDQIVDLIADLLIYAKFAALDIHKINRAASLHFQAETNTDGKVKL